MKVFTKVLLILTLMVLPIMATAAGLGTQIAVRLVGAGDLFIGDDLFEEFGFEPAGALCYPLDLVDVKTGAVIGDAFDCLTDITPTGTGVALTGTTFFFFPGGSIVTQGLTTVQPILHGSADFTHITGAVPSEGDNNVIWADGKFRGVNGTARLSGAVNLTDFPDSAAFDCVFILDVSR